MQGIKTFFPTAQKATYINALLHVGFDTVDFGSFVSPKAIPQMRDTAAVLSQLDLSKTNSKLLAIVANTRGARDACAFEEIQCLGFPFSISEIFQMRNTQKNLQQSQKELDQILNIAAAAQKEVVVYLSMGFGNPYGEPWSLALVTKWVQELVAMGVGTLSLSDTVGMATPASLKHLFAHLISKYPQVAFGAHLHASCDSWQPKVAAAYQGGCRRFDGAIRGQGGCPMANDALVGNMPTEKLLSYFTSMGVASGLHPMAFESAYNASLALFSKIL